MRRILRPKIRFSYIAISITLTFLLFLNIFSIPNVSANPDNELIVYIADINGSPINELYELENFIVSVYVLDDDGTPNFLTEVEILFNNKIHLITGEDVTDKLIAAPSVDSDTDFTINASKDGYISNETTLKVLNSFVELPELSIDVVSVIDANKKFTVTVYDKETGLPLNGVSVAIQNEIDKPVITGAGENPDGVVVLTAPEDSDSIIIIASKEGYVKDTAKVYINIEEPFWNSIVENKYFFIVIAAICLICAIIFVNMRSRRSIFDRAKELSNEKTKKRYETEESDIVKTNEEKDDFLVEGFSGKPIRSKPDTDPKVEEIRISRPQKDKEIVKVKETVEEKTDKIVEEKRTKKKDYDWFEGTDDIRYEIDKLTGEVDEDGVDKWFEGVGNLKDKIDEKVKKKDKKKNEEKEE